MTYEEILLKYLRRGFKPTRAVETALDEYNNSRSVTKGISISTAWRKYKKNLKKIKNDSEIEKNK